MALLFMGPKGYGYSVECMIDGTILKLKSAFEALYDLLSFFFGKNLF